MDSSGSIGYDNYQIMKNFVADLVDLFDIGYTTRVGLIQFSDSVTRVFRLGEYTTRYDTLHQ